MTEPLILCVDDEAEVLASLRRALLTGGYRVVTAASGEEGLARLQDSPAEVVISDYRMPGMTGEVFLAEVHRRHPDSVGLLLSGFEEAAAMAGRAPDEVVYAFLPKPWQEVELLLTVRRGLQHLQCRREVARLEARLRRQERELLDLRGAVQRLPFGLALLDRDGNLLLASRPGAESPLLRGAPGPGTPYREALRDEVAALVEGLLSTGTGGAKVPHEAAPAGASLPLSAAEGVVIAGGFGVVLVLRGGERRTIHLSDLGAP